MTSWMTTLDVVPLGGPWWCRPKASGAHWRSTNWSPFDLRVGVCWRFRPLLRPFASAPVLCGTAWLREAIRTSAVFVQVSWENCVTVYGAVQKKLNWKGFLTSIGRKNAAVVAWRLRRKDLTILCQLFLIKWPVMIQSVAREPTSTLWAQLDSYKEINMVKWRPRPC